MARKFFVHFGKFRREGVSERSRGAVAAALKDVKRALEEFDKPVDRALEDTRLSKKSKRFLQDLWYGKAAGRPLSLGNRAVRRASMLALIIVLLVRAQSCRDSREGRKRFRMLTTSPDLAITDFDEPVINLAALGRQFDQAARAARIDALGFIDVALLDDRSSPQPTILAAHMHAAIRAQESSFRVNLAQRLAGPVTRPRNRFGFRVVKIKGKKRDRGKPLSRHDVAGLGYYCAKPSCGLTAFYVDQRGVRQSRTTLHRWTMVQGLRQLELYSHCDVLQTTRGVGGGKHWRRQWKSLLLRLLKHSGCRGLKIDHVELEHSWERVWSELGLQHMKAVKIL